MNYYPHHIGDYAKDTGHLSWDEDMAYTRLLRAYYGREGAIPADQAYRLARAATRAQKEAVDSVLSEFFVQQDDGWHNKRADAELVIAQAKSEKARISAGKRWHTDTSNANAMRTHTEGNAPNNQEPITKNQRKESTPPASRPAPASKKKVSMPESFAVSERVKAWAAGKGFDRLDEHLESFRLKCAAKDYKNIDWDAAFMEAVREDWAKLRGGTRTGAPPAVPIADGKIACRKCSTRVTSHTNFVCGPCVAAEEKRRAA